MINENELPKNWEMKNLGEVCDFYQGYGFPKHLQGESTGQYPFYKVGDISKNVQLGFRYLVKCNNFIDEKTLNKLRAKPYPKNTIVFAKIGEALKLNRRAIIKTSGIVDNNAIGLKARNEICDDLFLFHFLQRLRLEDYSRATTVPSVRKSDIEEIAFPLPPLAEQERIVAKIEELFSELDAGLESLKTAQAQLKTYRQAVLKYAFESSEKAESIRLEDCCEFITKGTTPSKDKLFDKEGEVPFIKVYNLTFDGTLDFSINPTFVNKETHDGFLNRSKVIPNDVLMNIVGPPLGKVSVVPNLFPEWNINQAIARFRCKNVLLNRYLLHYLTSTNTIRQYSKKAKATAGQFNLTLEICRNITIPVSSLEEQQRIVEEIESRLSVCDKLEETINASLKQAEALRQSILKQAFEGKLV